MQIEIEKKLHHRHPYLMVDQVEELTPTQIKTIKTPKLDDFYIAGHFPGAMMQEMTTQAAGLLISVHHSPVANYDSEKTKGHALGVLRSVHSSKFKTFAKPGNPLSIHVELIQKIDNSFRFKGSIISNNTKIMSNEFTLINISDEHILD